MLSLNAMRSLVVSTHNNKLQNSISRLPIYLHALAEISYIYTVLSSNQPIICYFRFYFSLITHPLTPSLAWLSISRRPPDESYRGVTISVGGLGAACRRKQLLSGVKMLCMLSKCNVQLDDRQKMVL